MPPHFAQQPSCEYRVPLKHSHLPSTSALSYTAAPTISPTRNPTEAPSDAPTNVLTSMPHTSPTDAPSPSPPLFAPVPASFFLSGQSGGYMSRSSVSNNYITTGDTAQGIQWICECNSDFMAGLMYDRVTSTTPTYQNIDYKLYSEWANCHVLMYESWFKVDSKIDNY